MSEENPTHTQCIDCGQIWDAAAHWLIGGFVRDADGEALCRSCWTWREVERRRRANTLSAEREQEESER